MDSGRLVISDAVPYRAAAAAGGGRHVLLFGDGGGGGGFRGGTPVAGGKDGGRKRPFQVMEHEELRRLQPELADDELCGYDYELQGAPERAKRRLTAEQVRALELSFEEEKRKLEPERKSELARRLGMPPRQVAVWFQNRRARWRAKQLEQDFGRLRAAHDELLAGRDALLADNDRLRSQFVQAGRKACRSRPQNNRSEKQVNIGYLGHSVQAETDSYFVIGGLNSSVISLTEELEAKVSPAPVKPDQEQIAASAAEAIQGALHVQLMKEDQLCIDTTGSEEPARGDFTEAAINDSPESYFAGAPSPPSSSEGDYSYEVCTSFLPDATLIAAVHEYGRGHAEEDNWEWFWN
ncbi:hypothetical protein ACP70R_006487 [Stipagrostis hirtigluma subsp. patula]